MGSLTVRNLDEAVKKRLRLRAAANGRSMEEEIRLLLAEGAADAPVTRQSAKELVWRVERKLIEDAVRPIIFFIRQATCWQPEVKGLTLMDNSIFNSWLWRMSGSTSSGARQLQQST